MDHVHHFLPLLLLLPCTVMCTAVATVTSSSDSAYPTVTEDCSVGSGEAVPVPVRREVYDNGRIFDISHRYTAEMPSFASENGRLGSDFLWLGFSIKNGSLANASMMKFCVHSGTHVDAPGHVFDHYYHAGFDVDALDLEVLNGPALVVDVPRDKNITAEVMKALNIPKGVRRVLFRTLNTDRKIMWNVAYDTSATGFTEDGAKWLVQNTDIKLVGIDYLNVAAFVDVVPVHNGGARILDWANRSLYVATPLPVHNTFLEGREIILVEGLKLEGVPAGLYSSVHCLPLRLIGSDGSPARCILIK